MERMRFLQNVKAHEIKRALSDKHNRINDFFLTEVKNGPTHTATDLYIMDAIAIKKSWVNPLITGYEIKVSRNDFMQDEKWPAYKHYCHRLDFVVPTGLVQPDELPDDIGLIYYHPEKRTLYTRRRGKIRNIEMPYEMLYYIIMNRLDNVEHPFFSTKEEYFREYVDGKVSSKALGRLVSSKLINDVALLESENERLKREIKSMETDKETLLQIQEILRKHGIRPWRKEEYAERLDIALSSSVPPHLLNELEKIKDISGHLFRSLNKKVTTEGDGH